MTTLQKRKTVAAGSDSDEAAGSEDDFEEQPAAKRRGSKQAAASGNSKAAAAASGGSKYGPKVEKLRRMCKAAGITVGPSVYVKVRADVACACACVCRKRRKAAALCSLQACLQRVWGSNLLDGRAWPVCACAMHVGQVHAVALSNSPYRNCHL
jgi:hypothetical protein